MQFTDRSALDAYLNSIPKFKTGGASAANLGLNTIRNFAMAIGNPHKEFKSIHIAGTNGKGTTAHILAEVYRQAGFKVGLFTSPHLIDYSERVQVNGINISNEAMLQFFNSYEDEIEDYELSYFEISTALAFWHFAVEKVDIAVIETGLGGRLDSTNIIQPELSIITSISFDHADILGNTLAKIAAEKAGIIKKNTPVIIGNIDGEAREEILKKAKDLNSKVSFVEELKPVIEEASFVIDDGEKINLGNQLTEPVNRYNYSAAWMAIDELSDQFPIEKEMRTQYFRNIAPFRGRFEKLGNQDWYFSGAHNEESLVSTIKTIHNLQKGREAHLFITLMDDKWSEQLAELIKPYTNIYYLEVVENRGLPFLSFQKDIPQAELLDISAAELKLQDLKDELVIFMGSFYFYEIVKGLTDIHTA